MYYSTNKNATVSRDSCIIVVVENLHRPNSFLSDDQAFSRYVECLGTKMNIRHENFFVHRVVGVLFKKDFYYKPNLVLYIELHTTTNVTKEHVENELKKQIQSTAPSNCSKTFQVNLQNVAFIHKCNHWIHSNSVEMNGWIQHGYYIRFAVN